MSQPGSLSSHHLNPGLQTKGKKNSCVNADAISWTYRWQVTLVYKCMVLVSRAEDKATALHRRLVNASDIYTLNVASMLVAVSAVFTIDTEFEDYYTQARSLFVSKHCSGSSFYSSLSSSFCFSLLGTCLFRILQSIDTTRGQRFWIFAFLLFLETRPQEMKASTFARDLWLLQTVTFNTSEVKTHMANCKKKKVYLRRREIGLCECETRLSTVQFWYLLQGQASETAVMLL